MKEHLLPDFLRTIIICLTGILCLPVISYAADNLKIHLFDGNEIILPVYDGQKLIFADNTMRLSDNNHEQYAISDVSKLTYVKESSNIDALSMDLPVIALTHDGIGLSNLKSYTVCFVYDTLGRLVTSAVCDKTGYVIISLAPKKTYIISSKNKKGESVILKIFKS